MFCISDMRRVIVDYSQLSSVFNIENPGAFLCIGIENLALGLKIYNGIIYS